jgi:hypothetical protein
MHAVYASERLVTPIVQVQRLPAVLVLGLAVDVDIGRSEVKTARPVCEQHLALL